MYQALKLPKMVYTDVFGAGITSFDKVGKVFAGVLRGACISGDQTHIEQAKQLALSAKIRVADHCNNQDQASHRLEDLDRYLHQHQALLQHLQQ
jgi:hypothetical protein